LDQLGVDEQDAEFDVLEEPKLGLFGRVRSEARVRARIRPTSPRAKDPGRDRRRRRSSGASTPPDESPPSATTAPPAPEAAPPPARPRTRRSSAGTTEPDAQPDALLDRPSQPSPSESRRSSPGSTMHTDRDNPVPLLEQAQAGHDFLAGLLDAFGLAGDIEIRPRATGDDEEEVIDLVITGSDLGLLIGPQGGTLNAIQEIMRTAVQSSTGGRNGRLLVDVGGYRAKRAEALERFVRQVAAQVKASGDRLALEPMHAADRKVVHDTVNTIEGVSTISEGEEPRRRVVLEPFGG